MSAANKPVKRRAGIVMFDPGEAAHRPGIPVTWFYLLNDPAQGDRFLTAAYKHHSEHRLPTLAGIAVELPSSATEPFIVRQQAPRLLAITRRGDALLIAIEALGRSRKDWIRQIAMLLRRGLVVHLVGGPGDPLVLKGSVDVDTRQKLAEMVDRAGAETKSRRVKDAMAAARDGRRPFSSKPPIGMTVLNMPGGKQVLAASRADRCWISKIVAWRKAGWSRAQMLKELKQRRAKSGSGAPWTMRRLERIIGRIRNGEFDWLAGVGGLPDGKAEVG